MNPNAFTSYLGFGGAAICVLAYAWGYVIRPAGFRWVGVVSLFATVIALAQLTLVLRAGAPPGGSLNGIYALAFLLISGLAQSYMATQSRGARRADPNMPPT